MPSSPRIAVVGSAVTDLTTFTDVFPRLGETLFGKGFDLTEAELLTGLPVRSEADAAACAAVLLGQGFRRVLITLGARGSLLADAAGHTLVPPFPVTAADTTGAGDAFIGSLAVFLGEGEPEQAAVARANLYAALSSTQIGTQKSFPRRAEFEAQWDRRSMGPVR